MKQKYAIIRDDDQNILIVREYAELDKEMVSLLCEESYPLETMAAAVEAGHQAVIDAIRTNNMYPPHVFAGPIATAIEGLFQEGGNLSAELFFDDKELFIAEEEKQPIEAEEETKDEVDVDDLLEENEIEDDAEDEKVIKNLKSGIKVSDDDSEE